MSQNPDQSEQVTDYSESFFGILILDVITAIDRNNTSSSQSSRRDLIRTAFAALEGFVWIYRTHITAVAQTSNSLSPEEQFIFSEVSYTVSENGRIVKHSRFISLASMIRLTSRLAEKISPGLEIRFESAGWDQFRLAIEVRNRITHPKSKQDLYIEDRDISVCLTAFFWLLELVTNAMEAANDALAQYLTEFRTILEQLKKGDPKVMAAYKAAIGQSQP